MTTQGAVRGLVAERTGYWYSDAARTERAIEVLNAMRAYRSAEQAMRRRTQDSMGMGETDLAAVRVLLAAQRRGATVSPKDLGAALGVSGASVSVLIDRLVKIGYVERVPNPGDGRGVIVAPTDGLDGRVRETLGRMHASMLAVAESLAPEESDAVLRFLARMREAAERDGA